MSRLDEALARLRSGEPALLANEDRPGACALVFTAPDVTDGVLQALRGEGFGEPLLCAVRSDLGACDLRRALGIAGSEVVSHGILQRAAEAEAAFDAVRLAGRGSAAVLVPVRLADGMLAKDDAAATFAAGRGLPLFTLQDVIAERLARETIVEALASARLPSRYAADSLDVQAFRDRLDGGEHLAMIHGPLGEEPLVRLHSECLTGDALGSFRCDCGEQLRRSLKLIAEHADGGIVLYLRGHEGRGIGLVNKIRAYALQDLGRDTVEANVELGFPADLRSYGIAVQMLRALGVSRLKLLTNNPEKAKSLERYGIRVAARVPLRIDANAHNEGYLDTKRSKMGHDLLAR